MNPVRRLLIVDDEADFAAFVAEVGTRLGFTATPTTTAAAFRAAYLDAPPEVIVLDVVMPEKDGIETVQWLIDQGCRARVIVVSGYNPTYASAARLLGEMMGRLQISMLQKPVSVTELRAHLLGTAGQNPSG